MARAEKNDPKDRFHGGIMVKTLTVQCPHCHQVSDIYLSTNACVIVLNCPTCVSPIMYFEKKIFLLSEQQVNAIKDTTHNAAIMRMLDRIAHPEMPVRNVAKKATQIQSTNVCNRIESELPTVDFSDRPSRESDICNDDVMDLKIELALCGDSQQFIDNL